MARKPLTLGLIVLASAAVAATAAPGQADEPKPAGTFGRVPAAAPPATPDPDDEPSREEIDATARFFGIDDAAARARLASEREAMRLEADFRTRWPDELAGVWLDEVGGPDIFVSFSGNDAGRRGDEARGLSKLPERLVTRAANRSLAALEGMQQRMVKDREAAGAAAQDQPDSMRQARGAYDLDVDVRTNRLVVKTNVGDRASLERDMRRRYIPELDVVPAAARVACVRTDCR